MTAGRAKGIRAGRAFVEIGGDDTELQKVMRRASARLKAFGAGMAKIGAGIAAAGAAILAPLTAATAVFASYGDQLDKAAARTGLSVEALSELAFAAERSGASLEDVEKAVRKVGIAAKNALDGDAAFVDAFNELGINAEAFAKLKPEDQFLRVADALAKVDSPGRRAALAVELLGKSGAQLIPLLNLGADGIEALREEARKLGLTIDTETATAAAMLTDALGDLKSQSRAVAVAIGSALGPPLTELVRLINPAVFATIEFIKNNKALVAGVAITGIVLVALGTAFVLAGTAIALVGFALAGLATLFSPIGLTIAGIVLIVAGLVVGVVALGVAIVKYTSIGRAAVQTFATVWGGFGRRVIDVVRAVAAALAAGDLSVAVEVMVSGVLLAWEKGRMTLLDSIAGFGVDVLGIVHKIVTRVLRVAFMGMDLLTTTVLRSIDAISGTNYADVMQAAIDEGMAAIDPSLKLEEIREFLRTGGDEAIDAARERLYKALEHAAEVEEASRRRRERIDTGIDEAGSGVRRGIETFGSFGGGRLDQQFGGAGGVQNRQLEEQKKTAKNTARLVQAVDTLTTRLAFG